MTQKLHWLFVTPAFILVAVLTCGAAGAADKTKVDQATQRVQQGAREIGQGNVGTRVRHQVFGRVFRRLIRRAGLGDGPRPRLHDLRHTFALDTLRDWYRSGVDVERRLYSLSTYLGHVKPTSTYWYLTATPELLALAGARLERWRALQ